MKLATYIKDAQEQLALMVNGKLYDLDQLHPDLPLSMSMFLNYWDDYYPLALAADTRLKSEIPKTIFGTHFHEAQLMAPVPHPTSCRDGYAFRQHVAV